MPEWLVERGIGEVRAALVERGEVVEARILVAGQQRAGSVVTARVLKSGARNAVARDPDGGEYLLPRGAGAAAQGESIRIEIVREAIPGREPWKRPLAQRTNAPEGAGPEIAADARMLPFPAPTDELAKAGWNELIDEACTGLVGFPGGELQISVTPAMTLIDVDGTIDADVLAVAGATAAAKAIQRLDIGGSIGVDLPTAGSRAVRQAAAAAIDAHLPQPFERTAVNGFGFVQIVRPRRRASLLELAQDRAGFEARALLRRAVLERPGLKCIIAHSRVIGLLQSRPDWLDELARQAGGTASLQADPSLPISAGHVQVVQS